MGAKIDARTDIFSAGTLLYETLSGQNPFQAASSYDTLQRIRKGAITPVEELVPDVADEIGRIVRRAMAAQPEERYQTAGAALRRPDPVSLHDRPPRQRARLSDHLAALRSGSDDTGRGGDRSRPCSRSPRSTSRCRRARAHARRARAAPQARAGATPSSLPPRERTERARGDRPRGAPRRRRPDARRDDRAHRRALRRQLCCATLPTETAGKRALLALFGELDPDGRDADNAARCALQAGARRERRRRRGRHARPAPRSRCARAGARRPDGHAAQGRQLRRAARHGLAAGGADRRRTNPGRRALREGAARRFRLVAGGLGPTADPICSRASAASATRRAASSAAAASCARSARRSAARTRASCR